MTASAAGASVPLFAPGSDEYLAATRPANSLVEQRPAVVARPADAGAVAAAVREAAGRSLRVVPQATGHGAGADVDGTMLLDTSALDSVLIDPTTRTARTGAGATWGRVNAMAWQHGLLGRAGSAPSVAVSGYTFGGGIGWLVRGHGTAAGALQRVEYVTGDGDLRVAVEDAPDPIDRDALWAFRGGGGVGIATALEFDLVPIPELWSGYLLWDAGDLDAVVTAWAGTVDALRPSVATSIAVVHLPAVPFVPERLRGGTAVHLAVASSEGHEGARVLLEAVRAAAVPVADTWGPSDAARLAGIHLDPPAAVPALGVGRWLTADAPRSAIDVLRTGAEADTPLAQVELRNVGGGARPMPGAQAEVPGAFLLHAVGAVGRRGRAPLDAAFARLRRTAAAVDTGRVAAPWMDGADRVPDALPGAQREQVAAVADAVDPDKVLVRSRYLR